MNIYQHLINSKVLSNSPLFKPGISTTFTVHTSSYCWYHHQTTNIVHWHSAIQVASSVTLLFWDIWRGSRNNYLLFFLRVTYTRHPYWSNLSSIRGTPHLKFPVLIPISSFRSPKLLRLSGLFCLPCIFCLSLILDFLMVFVFFWHLVFTIRMWLLFYDLFSSMEQLFNSGMTRYKIIVFCVPPFSVLF